jgi:hypothetical protein
VQLQVAVELDPDGDPLGEPGTGAADLDRLDGALDVDRLEVGPVGLDPRDRVEALFVLCAVTVVEGRFSGSGGSGEL